MPRRERFLDRLAPEARAAVPVSYHLAESAEPGDASAARTAESRFYRAAGFDCHPCHKPVSRTLPPEER